MNSIVVYASRHGNTEKIAYAIASGLSAEGSAQVFAVDEAPTIQPRSLDLVVLGGPTEGHRMTAPMARYLVRVAGAFRGLPAATFDTRLRWPRWLSGSAAAGIAHKLQGFGAEVVAPPSSFFVAGKVPALETGELERAEAWGGSLAKQVAARGRLDSRAAVG
jgi:flavodoxin